MKLQLTIIALLAATPAAANLKRGDCLHVDDVYAEMGRNYTERPLVVFGNREDGTLYAIFLNAQDDTWTLFEKGRGELMCVVDFGDFAIFPGEQA